MINHEIVKTELLNFKTYQEIGDMFGVSRERIRQIARSMGLQRVGLETRKQERETQYQQNLKRKFGSFYEKGLLSETEWIDACKLKFRTKKNQVIYQSPWDWDLEFSDLDWVKVCPILGIELNYFSNGRSEVSPSFDRVDPNLGYIKGNVVIMSWRANRLKNDGTAEEHAKIAQYLKSS